MERHETIRTDVMKLHLDELMEILAGQRITEQKAGHGSDREKLRTEIREMASDKKNGSITFSYLRCGSITRKYDFYMAYYEEGLFVEEEPLCRYVDMSGFMRELGEDFEAICMEAKKGYIRVTAGETEYLWRCYMDKVYAKFESVVKAAVNDLLKENGVALYYGGYMEEQSLIGYV